MTERERHVISEVNSPPEINVMDYWCTGTLDQRFTLHQMENVT